MRRSVFVLCGVLVACSSSNSTSPGSGRLTVTITPPTGLTPSVVITGPGSYSKTVTSSTTLTGLTPGSYTIHPATVIGHDSIVPPAYIGTATGSPATVTAGGSASATVTYAMRAGSGAVWVVGGYPMVNDTTVNAAQSYGAAQMRATGAPTPVVYLPTTNTFGFNIDASGAAFDSAGNLWIANEWAGTIIELTPAQLVTGTAAPTVTIHDGPAEHALGTDGNNPMGLTFDAAGNLWVANSGPIMGDVIEYTASQLTSSGPPTPAVTLTPVLSNVETDSTLVLPAGLAFDTQGNLWVAGKGVYEFAANQLRTTGSVTPVRWFTPPRGAHGSYAWVTSLAFDDSGDLWFCSFQYSIIGEYTAAQIAAGGDPAPAVQMTLSGRFAPASLVFDR